MNVCLTVGRMTRATTTTTTLSALEDLYEDALLDGDDENDDAVDDRMGDDGTTTTTTTTVLSALHRAVEEGVEEELQRLGIDERRRVETLKERTTTTTTTTTTRDDDENGEDADAADSVYVKVPLRAIESLRLRARMDADETSTTTPDEEVQRARLDSILRVNSTMRRVVRDVLNAEDVMKHELESRLGKNGSRAALEAERERAALDLMLVLNARARWREAERALLEKQAGDSGIADEMEALKMKVAEAERGARESELVARSKVSKAFDKVKELTKRAEDAEASAEEEHARVRQLESELKMLKASFEEANEALQATNIKVSVLTAQVNMDDGDKSTDASATQTKGDVAMLNTMLASANEKLKKESEQHEAALREKSTLEAEVARLKPMAAATEEIKEELAAAVAEANEAKLHAENWKKLVDSKEHTSKASLERVRDDSIVNEKKLREALTRLNNELFQAKERASALEKAKDEAIRDGDNLHKQALAAGDRVAKNLRRQLEEVNDELSEIKRREAMHAAQGHAATEAVRKAAKFEQELKQARHKLADVEMALTDSQAAVKALQFELDVGDDSSDRDSASALRETRLRNDLGEALARASNAEEKLERVNGELTRARDELKKAVQDAKVLKEANSALTDRIDAAEKQAEISELLKKTSATSEDLNKLQTMASKVDFIVAENRRLQTECKTAVSALKTAEDTAETSKSALEREREEFEAWRKRARDIIDAKDREIDRIRARETNSPATALKASSSKSSSDLGLPPVSARSKEDAAYIKTVCLQFLFAEEWEVQQSLLPTVVNLCGGTADDLQRIRDIRSQFEPTFVHSTEVAINKSLEQSANAVVESANSLSESLGLGRLFNR